MGIAALKFAEGKYSNMMKLILLSALAAVALAEPEPHYGYYGYPFHQQHWPSVRAPGFSSTCWGCRGKRSAEPSPHGFYGYYGHPFVYHGLAAPAVADNVNRVAGVAAAVRSSFSSAWPGATVSVSNIGKRSAEPDNVNLVSGGSPFPSYTGKWPGATVSVDHGKKKRSAEPHGYYGYYGHPYGYYGYPYLHHVAHPALKVVDGAAGVHPGGATSSVSRSPQGLRGKRSAEPDNVNLVSGGSPFPSYTAAWPGATVSVDHGKKKRSAEVDNVNRVSGGSPFPSYTAA